MTSAATQSARGADGQQVEGRGHGFIPAYPFWSLTIIAMDVVALYGLCAYGRRANLAA